MKLNKTETLPAVVLLSAHEHATEIELAIRGYLAERDALAPVEGFRDPDLAETQELPALSEILASACEV